MTLARTLDLLRLVARLSQPLFMTRNGARRTSLVAVLNEMST